MMPERQSTAGARSAPRLSAPVRGALWMTAASVALSCMIGLVRLATESLHPFEVVFFRNLCGFLALLPWLLRTRFADIRGSRPKLHLFRALAGIASMLCWFYALSVMPLGEAVALSFTAPLFATVGAALFLGEIVRARRWSATAIGFVGVLVILRPGIEAISTPALIVLLSSVTGAAAALLVKRLSRTESSTAIVAYMGLFLTPLSLVPALAVWQWPSWETLLVLIAIGTLGTVGHLCYARAFKEADASAVFPFDYIRLPLVVLIGAVAFGETLDGWTALGAVIIGGSTLYIAVRETRIARERRPHDPGPIAGTATKEKL